MPRRKWDGNIRIENRKVKKKGWLIFLSMRCNKYKTQRVQVLQNIEDVNAEVVISGNLNVEKN